MAGLFRALKRRKEPASCPACGGMLVDLGPLGLYCIACVAVIGELPQGVFMVVGGPGVGKTALIFKIASILLQKGKPCVYVAFDQPPFKVRQSIKDFGYPMHERGRWGANQYADFILVDAFSNVAGLESDEEHRVEETYNLSQLNIALSRVRDAVGKQTGAIFLDSVNSFFMHLEAEAVLRFLHLTGAKLSGRGDCLYFSLGEGVVDASTQRKLESIVDGIIEMRVSTEGEAKVREFRISKARGKKMFEGWLRFEVVENMGFLVKHAGPVAEHTHPGVPPK